MFVSIRIKSAFSGAIIAQKIEPFYKGLIRDELASIRNYCRRNALESVIVSFNNHIFPLNF